MSRNWIGGSTPAWRRIRAVVLQRDNYQCQIKLPGQWRVLGGYARCKVKADCVHHKVGRGVTGDDMKYLEAACTPCNLKVGDPQKKADPAHVRPRWAR